MAAGATWTKISTVDVGSGGSVTFTFSSISSSYTDLMLIGSVRSSRASGDATEVRMTFNNTSNNYAYKSIYGNGSTPSTFNSTGTTRAMVTYTSQNSTNQTDTFGGLQICIPNKTYSGNPYYMSSGFSEIAATNGYAMWQSGANTNISSAVTSITFSLYSGVDDYTYLQYSTVTLYGLARA